MLFIDLLEYTDKVGYRLGLYPTLYRAVCDKIHFLQQSGSRDLLYITLYMSILYVCG